MCALERIDWNVVPNNLGTWLKPVIDEPQKSPEVKVVSSHHGLALCLDLRRRVFESELGEKDARLGDSVADILDETATHIGAFLNGKCVGYLRINFGDHKNNPYRSLYKIDDWEEKYGDKIGITSKLCVDQKFRGSTITHKMIKIAYEMCLVRGVEIVLIGCHKELAHFYSRMGFVSVNQSMNVPGIGEIGVQALNVWDQSHLEAVRSPFLKLLKQFSYSSQQNQVTQEVANV